MMARHGAAVLLKSLTYRIPSPRYTTFCVENHQNINKYASGSHLFSERGALLPLFGRGFHPVTGNRDRQLRSPAVTCALSQHKVQDSYT